MQTGAVDVLESGTERRPALLAHRVVLVVLGLVALSGFALDRQLRQAEFDALLAQAAAGQAAVAYADRRLGATVQYASPVLGSAQTSGSVRASLQGLVEQEAAQQAVVLRRHARASARIAVWPWHEQQRSARSAYVSYLVARAAYLEAVATDFDVLYGRPPELAARLAEAARAYDRAAVRRADALAARQLLLGRVRGQLSP